MGVKYNRLNNIDANYLWQFSDKNIRVDPLIYKIGSDNVQNHLSSMIMILS